MVYKLLKTNIFEDALHGQKCVKQQNSSSAATTASSLLVSCFSSRCWNTFSHKSINAVQHWMLGYYGLARRLLDGVELSLCADEFFHTKLRTPGFCLRGASPCWNSRETNTNCCHKNGKTGFCKISFTAVVWTQSHHNGKICFLFDSK